MNLKVGDVFQHKGDPRFLAKVVEVYLGSYNIVQVKWYREGEEYVESRYPLQDFFALATKLDERPLEEQVKELLG